MDYKYASVWVGESGIYIWTAEVTNGSGHYETCQVEGLVCFKFISSYEVSSDQVETEDKSVYSCSEWQLSKVPESLRGVKNRTTAHPSSLMVMLGLQKVTDKVV